MGSNEGEAGRPVLSTLWSTRQNSRAIQLFCKPLDSLLGIDTFWHYTISEEGHFSYIGNRGDEAEFFMKEKLYIGHPHFRHPSFFSDSFLLADETDDPQYEATQGRMRDDGVLDQVFLILKKRKGCLFGYGFATTKRIEGMANVYLNNMGLLERFIERFHQSQKKPVDDSYAQSIDVASLIGSVFYEPPKFYKEPMTSKEANERIATFEKSGFRKNGLHGLSKRERECLYWLLSGRSAREIAQALKLSVRTVETHLNNAKNRCGVDTRAELFDLLAPFRDSLLVD